MKANEAERWDRESGEEGSLGTRDERQEQIDCHIGSSLLPRCGHKLFGNVL